MGVKRRDSFGTRALRPKMETSSFRFPIIIRIPTRPLVLEDSERLRTTTVTGQRESVPTVQHWAMYEDNHSHLHSHQWLQKKFNLIRIIFLLKILFVKNCCTDREFTGDQTSDVPWWLLFTLRRKTFLSRHFPEARVAANAGRCPVTLYSVSVLRSSNIHTHL